MFRLRTFKRLAIFAILLTVPVYVFTGCERITVDNVFQNEDLDFIDTLGKLYRLMTNRLNPF